MEGIGIVFDIDELKALDGWSSYGEQAWRIFMQNLRPNRIIGCMLREGDTRATLSGSRREFCIGIFGITLDVETVKTAFAASSEKGLAESSRRFIYNPVSEPLVEAGFVDSFSRLVQDKWNRVFHDRCKNYGWGYAPQSITVDLPPELKGRRGRSLKSKYLSPAKKKSCRPFFFPFCSKLHKNATNFFAGGWDRSCKRGTFPVFAFTLKAKTQTPRKASSCLVPRPVVLHFIRRSRSGKAGGQVLFFAPVVQYIKPTFLHFNS